VLFVLITGTLVCSRGIAAGADALVSGPDNLERTLSELAKRQEIRRVSLAIMPDGPKQYRLSQEADVTVILYERRKVEANHAFRKGELNDKAIESILVDVWNSFPVRADS